MKQFKTGIKFSVSLASLLMFVGLVSLFGCKATSLVKPSEGYVNVKGGKIWYRILGESDAKPLLLLHGGPGSTSQYFYECAPLSEDRPIILFDQLGSGQSTYHTDTTLLTVENFVDQVEEVKSALGLKEYYLLGHSWGSALALEYYLEYPKGVKGIIFSSPFLSTPKWTADADTLIGTLPDSIQRIIALAEKNDDFDTPEYKYADSIYWSKFGLRTEERKHPLDTVSKEPNPFIYNYMWGPSEFTATGILKNYDRIEGLEELKVPVLFVTGEFDEARPTTVRQYQALVPNLPDGRAGSKMEVIDGAGHSTMRDNTLDYNNSIQGFLRKIELEN